MHLTLTSASHNLKRDISRHLRPGQLPAVFLMSDEDRLPNPVAVLPRLPRGSGVILRHYNDPERAKIAKRLSVLCRRRKISILVGGNWKLAARIGAHGLHLPGHMARAGLEPAARLWLKQRKGLLTVAAHGPQGLRQARKIGATAALLSPIFPTSSHPDGRPLGPVRCAAMVRRTAISVIALGGVTAKTVNALRGTGCHGFAGISFASRNQGRTKSGAERPLEHQYPEE